MTHGSLFSGIGGFELAAEWRGWENVFHCENKYFPRKVLQKRFPGEISYGDINETDFTIHRGGIDVVSGGFPCQPFSKAGKRKGTGDGRYLWGEMFRAIKEVEPAFVVGENVPGIINYALHEIWSQLEDEGYRIQPFCIPASAVGNLSNRDRIWIIAIKKDAFNSSGNCIGSYREKEHNGGSVERGIELRYEQISLAGSVVPEGVRSGADPRIFGVADGLSDRVDRLTAIGNAICPQVAFEIFGVIEEYAKKNTNHENT